MVTDGAGDADVAFPPWTATAAPTATAPPRMAKSAILRDEMRDPGSTFVCEIEAAAIWPPRDALTRI